MSGIISSVLANFIYDLVKPLNLIKPGLRERILISLAFKRKELGIKKYYKYSKESYDDIEPYFESSESVKIMQIRGQHLIDKQFLTKHLQNRNDRKLETKLLLLNPNSVYATKRAKKLNKIPSSYVKGIESTIGSLENFINEKNLNVEFCLYSQDPVFCIFLFNEALFLSFYTDIEASKGKERHKTECYQITKNSLLYQSIKKHFDFVWEEESSPIDELKEHIEVEKKFEIVDYDDFNEVLKSLSPEYINKSLYEDYYFTRNRGKHFEKEEREYRVRVNLDNKKVFLTKKRKFNNSHKESKFEMETYVGYYHKLDFILKSIENNGYHVYSSFKKETINHKIILRLIKTSMGSTEYVFIFTISKLKTNNYNIIHELFDSQFLEIETLVPKNTPQDKIEKLNGHIDNFAQRFGKSIKPCQTTYSKICMKKESEPVF